MSRAALSLGVSTREQTTENQERELRAWVERLGFEVVKVDTETALKIIFVMWERGSRMTSNTTWRQ